MRPVVVTAVLLLVVLMSMSASAAWDPESMCQAKFLGTPCRRNMGQEGWYQFGQNRCVKTFLDRDHQSGAKKLCRSFTGGDLVSIHSLAELCEVECVMYLASNRQREYWIGLERSGNTFVWTDGSEYKYSNWHRRQPAESGGSEDCVEMGYYGWGIWNDGNCLNRNSLVCQVKL